MMIIGQLVAQAFGVGRDSQKARPEDKTVLGSSFLEEGQPCISPIDSCHFHFLAESGAFVLDN